MWRLGRHQRKPTISIAAPPSVTKEGPFAQAHEFYGPDPTSNDAPVRIALRGANMKECISGVAFTDVVINTFFGYMPSIDGKRLLTDETTPRPFSGTLENVSHGRAYLHDLRRPHRAEADATLTCYEIVDSLCFVGVRRPMPEKACRKRLPRQRHRQRGRGGSPSRPTCLWSLEMGARGARKAFPCGAVRDGSESRPYLVDDAAVAAAFFCTPSNRSSRRYSSASTGMAQTPTGRAEETDASARGETQVHQRGG